MSRIRRVLSQIHRARWSGPVGFGIVTYRPGGGLGPRQQTNYQLVIIHRGEMTVTVDGEQHRVGEGEGILLKPGSEERFHFSKNSETTHSWCQIPPDQAPKTLAFGPDWFAQQAPCSRWLLDFMLSAHRTNGRLENLADRNRLIGLVMGAMWAFCGGLAKPDPRPFPEALQKAQLFMEEKLDQPLTLAEMAAAASVSKGHLIHLSNTHWGMTPVERLWQLRLEEAARLLRETGLSISEVAYRIGFANPYHFSRRFKQRYGRSAKTWRALQWKAA